jgi:transposase
MEHVAIDLGGRESQVCVRSADGRIVEETRIRTDRIGGYLQKRPNSRVIVETCAEAFCVADTIQSLGHEVRIVPATLVRALGVGDRSTKTDRRDAQKLSEASCRIDLPSVHLPSQLARERKSCCGMREALVAARTQIANNVRGWLRTQGMRVSSGSVETLAPRVRKLKELPTYVERNLQVLETLTEQVAEADKELARLAKQDPTCRRLMSVPGVGPATAMQFVATLDQVERFPSAHALESYLGLVPGESSSSDRQHRLSITKAGSPRMRCLLVQCAWIIRRTCSAHPMAAWALEIEKRRGKRIAVVALARKLAGILFAIWRDGSLYARERTANPPTPAL